MPYKPELAQLPALGSEIFTTVTASANIGTADHRKYLNCVNGSAITLTLTADSSSDPVLILIDRNGAGSVTVALGLLSGMTLNGTTTNRSIGTRYQTAILRRIAQNTWVMRVFGA